MKRDNNSNPNAGWNQREQWFLNKYENVHEPDVQILTEDDYEDADLTRREYFCAICKSRLDFLKETKTIWRCNECMQYYDTSIQDVPVKDLSESKVKAYPELDRYPTAEENSPYTIFIQGINPDPDAETSIPGNVQVLRDDGRVKHIRVKGLPTEALAAMNELDDK